MSGETMRDRFAMDAFRATIARDGLPHNEIVARALASTCYSVADAMLAARGGGAPQPASDAVKQQMLEALKATQDAAMPWNKVEAVVAAAIAAAEKEQSA